jgi:hypothetical protein
LAEVIDLTARHARSGQAAELIVERAVYEILGSIHSMADSRAALHGLARSLTDRDISAVLFGQAMQMVINRMLEIGRGYQADQPDPAA